MLVSGKIESIVYRNEENDYSVVKISSHGEFLTCVGKFPSINVGERVELEGTVVKNEKYGEQISVSSVKVLPPNDEEGIKKYLSSGLIKGIGIVTANNIVDMFGSDVRFYDQDDTHVSVAVNANETSVLQFAKNYAPDVVILEPKELRDRAIEDLKKGLKGYEQK